MRKDRIAKAKAGELSDEKLTDEEEVEPATKLDEIYGFVTDEKDFRHSEGKVCPYCYQQFISHHVMERHLNSIHELTKIYKCPKCDFINPTPRALEVHCQNAHDSLQVIF